MIKKKRERESEEKKERKKKLNNNGREMVCMFAIVKLQLLSKYRL